MNLGDPPSYDDPDWEWSDLYGWRRKPQPWLETHHLLGGATIYNTAGDWVQVRFPPELTERVAELERRVARLETARRRTKQQIMADKKQQQAAAGRFGAAIVEMKR